MKVERWLRGYNADDDTLLAEVSLAAVNLETLRTLVGANADDILYECYPVAEAALPELLTEIDHPVILPPGQYFIECNSGEQELDGDVPGVPFTELE